MKRLILILALVISGVFSVQSQTIRLDSIVMPVGADTVKAVLFQSSQPRGINFDRRGLTGAGTILDLGTTMSPDSIGIFDRLDDERLPLVLVNSTVSFNFIDGYGYKWLLIKVTKVTAAAGEKIYFWRW